MISNLNTRPNALLRWLSAGLLAFTLAQAAPSAMAQPDNPPTAPQFRKLNLSDEQMRQVQEMRQQTMGKLRRLQNQLRQTRRQLEVLYRDYDLDQPQARQLNEKINQIQKDILDTHLQVEKRLREILRPEQFNQLRADMQKRPPKKT